MPSRLCESGRFRPGHRLHALEHRAARVELELLLREVRRLDAVPELHASGRGLAPAEDRLEQRRLAGAVRPDERDVLAALERERRAAQQLALADPHVEPLGLDARSRPLRAGFRNSKPSERCLRERSAISAFASCRSCSSRPICVSFACACFAFDFL